MMTKYKQNYAPWKKCFIAGFESDVFYLHRTVFKNKLNVKKAFFSFSKGAQLKEAVTKNEC